MPLASRACIGTVKNNLSSTTVETIVIPGTYMQTCVIQNNTTVAFRMTIDGGSTYTDQQTGKAGADPTTTSGIVVAAGASYTINTLPNGAGLHRPIRIIFESSGATGQIDIDTDDSPGSNASTTFPTS